MANTNLTPDIITRESITLLHQKSSFLNSINRQYDSRFSQSGAGIGDSLRIRIPSQFNIRTGMDMSVQDIVQESKTLTVDTVKGVDYEFESKERALDMDLDKFSELVLEPAMSKLAAEVERDILGKAYLAVNNQINNIGSDATRDQVLDAKKILTDNLAPVSNRRLLLGTKDNNKILKDLSGLYNDSNRLSKQQTDGLVASNFLGFQDVFETTSSPIHTTGTSAASGYLINGAVTEASSTIPVDTGTGSLKQGDIITIANVKRLHPEIKTNTGELQQFVVTADYAGGAGNVAVYPALIAGATDARRNITALPADNAVITKVGGASVDHDISLGYHRDSFIFATADLHLPNGTHKASRKNYDGFTLSYVEDFDISTRKTKCRFDILYGFKAIRPETAVRIANN